MDAVSPLYLLLAGLICSMVGRFMLVRAAWEISKGWGVAVACIPLAPLIFRWNYKELAGEGKNWLMATNICFVTFGALTGSRGVDSIDDLWTLLPERFRPAEYAEHREDPEEIVPEGAQEAEEPEEADVVATEAGVAPSAAKKLAPTAAPAAAPTAKATFFGRIATLLHRAPAEPAKSPAPAVALTPVATGPTLSERLATNQAEFTRLGVVYEGLKKERGYLKKWDQDQIKSYNEQAAKYQADLAKARADQVELNKQVAAVTKK
jgi:hypothetical protein